MKRLGFWLAPLAFLGVPAAAQDCASPRTQFDLNVCSSLAAQAADDELNRLWRMLKPIADARGDGQALLSSQRAWLKYRDATCEAERDSYGQGSFAPTAYYTCIERMTRQRNADFRAMF